MPLYRDIDLVAIPKTSGDIRPIGVNNIDRKIAAAACNIAMKDLSGDHFENLQYCLEKNGCEKIVHLFSAGMEEHPEFDTFLMDGDNAFNNLCRAAALTEVKKHFPECLPFLRSIYGTKSNAWFTDGSSATPISSQEGVHQGCKSAMWLYAVGTLPFLKGLRNIIGDDGFLAFFADDGNISAPFKTMVACVRYVLHEGPKYGYILKRTKGSYLLGRCGSTARALRRKDYLCSELGLSHSVVKIHPDDVDDDIRLDTRRAYGAKVLGSWIGDSKFIKKQLKAALSELNTQGETIKALTDVQLKYLLLRYCFSAKINYVQRTTPMNLCADFVDGFESIKRDILASIMDNGWDKDTVPDDIWEQCCFNVTDGGLGLRDAISTTPCAFVASVTESLQVVLRQFPHFRDTLTSTMGTSKIGKDFRRCLRFINLSLDEPQRLYSVDDAEKVLAEKAYDKTLQGILHDRVQAHALEQYRVYLKPETHRLAFFTSVSDGNAGRWLDVCPKSDHFSFTSDEFRALLNYRLFLRQPSFIPGSRCSCKSRPELDPLGHHLATACGKGGYRNATHTGLQYGIKDLLSCAGIMARQEEYGCFQGADENSNLRPDLSIWNMPHCPKKVVADIQVTCPVPVRYTNALSVREAQKPGRAADHAHKSKVRKYAEIAAANNLEFQTLIFEFTGRLHFSCERFLKSAISKMAQGNNALSSIE